LTPSDTIEGPAGPFFIGVLPHSFDQPVHMRSQILDDP